MTTNEKIVYSHCSSPYGHFIHPDGTFAQMLESELIDGKVWCKECLKYHIMTNDEKIRRLELVVANLIIIANHG